MARTYRINLSTRPFYNERAVHAALALVAAVVLALSAFNLWQVYVLSGRHAELQGRLSQAETKTRELRDQATVIRRSINPRELEATVAAAREANVLIERRVFSWTEVLNQFETTLPASVRISSVRPRVERDGTMMVDVVVLARTVESVDAFIENLEKRGAFSGRAVERGVHQRGRAHPGQHRGAIPAGPRAGRRREGRRAMSASLRRVFLGRRVIILPLAVALLANAAIFGLVVYPSSGRVARAEQQEQVALQELAAAQREFAAATRTQRDKVRAEEDLQKFYNDVLPADMAGARRATYLHLAQLARDAGLVVSAAAGGVAGTEGGRPGAGADARAFRHHDGARGRLRRRAPVPPGRRGLRRLHRDRQRRPGGRRRSEREPGADGGTLDLLSGGDTWKLTGVRS